MKKFLFNFGIEKNLIWNMTQSQLMVYIPLKPILRNQLMNQSQRNYIFTLEFSPFSYALLVCFSITKFSQVLQQRYKDVFGVIFFKFCLLLWSFLGMIMIFFVRDLVWFGARRSIFLIIRRHSSPKQYNTYVFICHHYLGIKLSYHEDM